jgi:hypothetical protein
LPAYGVLLRRQLLLPLRIVLCDLSWHVFSPMLPAQRLIPLPSGALVFV